MGDVKDYQRFVHVHLEIATGAAKAYGHIVCHHLHGDHGQCLGLGRIHLARHDGGARLVLRQEQFAQAAARAGGQPAHVVGNLHQGHCEPAQRRHCGDHGVERTLRRELVGRGHERIAGQPRDLGGDLPAEVRWRVQPRADGGPSGRQLEQARLGGAEARQRIAELVCVARPFLPYR